MKKLFSAGAAILICALCLSAQTAASYGGASSSGDSVQGLLDPSRFSIHRSMSFGMSTNSTSASSVQSQGIYSTLMQYRFAAPVTLNLSFDMPIFSSYQPQSNLSMNNLNSLDYFKAMPFSASLTWKPTQNTLMLFSVTKESPSTLPLYDRSFFGYDLLR